MSNSNREPHRVLWFPFVIAVTACGWIYFGDLADLLLDTHDAETFRDNVLISDDFSYFFSSAKEVPSGRPTAELVKWLAYLTFGNDPRWFHLLSVFLHTSATILLALWVRRLGESLEFSWCAALLFFVNVGHFQAVQYISALDYPLSLLFALISLLSFDILMSGGRPIWRASWLTFLVLGTLSHLSAAVVWPISAFWYWQRRGDLRGGLRQFVLGGIVGLPTVLLGLFWAADETSTWQAINSYGDATTSSSSPGGAVRVLVWLLSRLITTAHWLPMSLYARHPWELYVGFGLLVLFVVLVAKGTHRLRLWALWVLLSLLPFALLNERIVLDLPSGPSRYLYGASAGSSVLLAWLVRKVISKFGRFYGPTMAVCYFALMVSSYYGLKRVEALGLYTSGRSYISNGDNVAGAGQLSRAIEHSPETIPLADAYARLSYALLYLGEDPGIVLQEATDRFPDNLRLTALGAVYQMETESPDSDSWRAWIDSTSQQAQAAGFVEHFDRNFSAAYYNLGVGYSRRDLPDRAVRVLTKALEYTPDRAMIKIALGEAHAQIGVQDWKRGNRQAAVDAFDQALRSDPGNVKAAVNLGWSFFEAGQLEAAIDQFRQVLQTTSSSHAHFNLALSYLASGEVELAENTYAKAVELHGTLEGEQVGAVDDLINLVNRGTQAKAATEILQKYWGGDSSEAATMITLPGQK
jgi:tetratricopeptide (TPR) repeat protein